MAVTVINVFNACANTPSKPDAADPLVVFTSAELTVDSDGGKLAMVDFRPYIPGVTAFKGVAFHIHTKPHSGKSGLNVRDQNASTGVVGSGLGTMAHGESVPLDSPYLGFYKKLKDEAKRYICGQILKAANAKKVLPTGWLQMSPLSDDKKMERLWGDATFWQKNNGFRTTAVELSSVAQACIDAMSLPCSSVTSALVNGKMST